MPTCKHEYEELLNFVADEQNAMVLLAVVVIGRDDGYVDECPTLSWGVWQS
jgi:hypothetical protein